MNEDLCAMTLAQASRGLQQRAFSSVEITRACLDRIEAFAPQLNCFVEVTADAAMAQARIADAQLHAGDCRSPLHGIPLAEKDMFFRAGRPSSMGSKLGARFTPTVTATVLRDLDAAGAVSVGRLHMAEFAAGPTGQNEYLGSCRNPWNPQHISGGSSSGSGSAVAARMVYGSLGSDTGGSVRLPAGMCGVVGLKPTHGAVSRHGGMPRCWSLDVFGPIARTALDCALLFAAIEGSDPEDPATYAPRTPVRPAQLGAPLKGRRIGLPRNRYLPDAAPAVVRALEDALAVLQDAGCVIVPVDLPDPEPIYALTQIVNKSEAAALHARWIGLHHDDYGLSSRSRMEAGFHIPAALYLWALAARPRRLRAFAEAVFTRVDALMLPLLTEDVPTIAAVDMSAARDVPAIIDRITRCTRWVSYLGLPAIVAPCGLSERGLPIGFQLLGRPYSEQLLLDLVHQYQDRTAWHQRTPPLAADGQGALR